MDDLDQKIDAARKRISSYHSKNGSVRNGTAYYQLNELCEYKKSISATKSIVSADNSVRRKIEQMDAEEYAEFIRRFKRWVIAYYAGDSRAIHAIGDAYRNRGYSHICHIYILAIFYDAVRDYFGYISGEFRDQRIIERFTKRKPKLPRDEIVANYRAKYPQSKFDKSKIIRRYYKNNPGRGRKKRTYLKIIDLCAQFPVNPYKNIEAEICNSYAQLVRAMDFAEFLLANKYKEAVEKYISSIIMSADEQKIADNWYARLTDDQLEKSYNGIISNGMQQYKYSSAKFAQIMQNVPMFDCARKICADWQYILVPDAYMKSHDSHHARIYLKIGGYAQAQLVAVCECYAAHECILRELYGIYRRGNEIIRIDNMNEHLYCTVEDELLFGITAMSTPRFTFKQQTAANLKNMEFDNYRCDYTVRCTECACTLDEIIDSISYQPRGITNRLTIMSRELYGKCIYSRSNGKGEVSWLDQQMICNAAKTEFARGQLPFLHLLYTLNINKFNGLEATWAIRV